MNKEEKFVRIQSTMNITVTPGLQATDVTNADAHIPDRLRISSLWAKATVDIYEGIGLYPAYITDWNTVKCLVKDGIITIGAFFDNANGEEESKKDELDANLEEIKAKSNITYKEDLTKIKKANKKEVDLTEIAGE